MRRLVLALAVVGALSVAGTTIKRGPGPGDGVGVPGLSGGVATDSTIEFIYEMDHFLDYEGLPKFYFSEGTAGGELPVGVDTNPCTKEQPCRTIDRMEVIADRGKAHIILDADDDWDLAADWTAGGGDSTILVSDPANCVEPGRACVIFSSSSFRPGPVVAATGQSGRARITCTNSPAGTLNGLFVFGATSDRGWMGIENIEFNDCPKSVAFGTLDLVRTQDSVVGPSKIVGLNLKTVTGVRGADADGGQNDFYTSHSGAGVGVMLNSEAFIENSGVGYAADLFDASTGDMIIIGRSELFSLDVDGSWFGAQSESPNASAEIVMVGHTINDRLATANAFGVSMQHSGAAGVTHRIFLADVTINGFTGANGTNIQTVGASNNVATETVQLFRTTFRNFVFGAVSFIPLNLASNWTGRCMLIDNGVAGFLTAFWINSTGRANSIYTGTTFDFEGLQDNEAAGTHYTIFNDNSATAALADAAAPASWNVFQTNSIESGAGADGDPFGTMTNHFACNSADCLNRCSAANTATWAFARHEIPSFVLGTPVRGLQLGGRRSHFGAR